MVQARQRRGVASGWRADRVCDIIELIRVEAELVVDLPEKIRVESWLVPRPLTRSWLSGMRVRDVMKGRRPTGAGDVKGMTQARTTEIELNESARLPRTTGFPPADGCAKVVRTEQRRIHAKLRSLGRANRENFLPIPQ